ncbi:hypothetical protein AB1L30_25130 [Bremerella sp. JC817]|uniref:hypothetical protein n=1 Tax=Bremerella sp. JC817 TaxID=3231756 RepID=UPI003459C82C
MSQVEVVSTADKPDAGPSLLTVILRLLISGLAWGIHVVVTAAMIMFYGSIVPMFIRMFEHFELDLPAGTELVIRWSSTVSSYWYIPALLVVLLDGPIALAVPYLPQRLQWLTWLWFVGYLLLLFGALWFSVIFLALPVQDLMVILADEA